MFKKCKCGWTLPIVTESASITCPHCKTAWTIGAAILPRYLETLRHACRVLLFDKPSLEDIGDEPMVMIKEMRGALDRYETFFKSLATINLKPGGNRPPSAK